MWVFLIGDMYVRVHLFTVLSFVVDDFVGWMLYGWLSAHGKFMILSACFTARVFHMDLNIFCSFECDVAHCSKRFI